MLVEVSVPMLNPCRSHTWFVAVALFAVALPVRAAEVEKYFPDDAEAVLTLNIKQILESPLLKSGLEAAKRGIQDDAEAQKTLKDLGFDPFKDLEQVAVAMPGGQPDRALLLVQGRFDVAKFEAKAEEAGKGEVKVHNIGDRKVFESKVPVPNLGDQSLFICLLDPTTIAVSGTKEGVVDALDKKAGKKKTMLKKELQDLLAKADPKQSLSVVMLGTAAGLADVSDKVQHVTGGVTLVNDVNANFVVAAKNADAAKEVENAIKEGLGQLKTIVTFMAANQKELAPLADLFGVIKVTSEGSTVTIKGQVTKEAIEKSLKKSGQ
jgi:hypothetical protein